MGKSIADTSRLTPGYRRLTGAVGVVGASTGIVAIGAYIFVSAELFGLPIDGGPLDGIWLGFLAWLVALLLAMPILVYLGTVVVAGLLACGFLLVGKMTRDEAVSYMFLSQYPGGWFAKVMPTTPDDA